MPKTKSSVSAKLKSSVKEFGEQVFSTDGKILFCKICEVKVTSKKRFNVKQHCNTARHKNGLDHLSCKETRQRLLMETAATSSPSMKVKVSEFSSELCEALISANIPLNKVSNEKFKFFLEKYTQQKVPHESTLRKNYLPVSYENTLRSIRNSVSNQKIWVSIDETTDVDGRCVANVIIGTLKPDGPGKTFLLTSEVLEQTNHSTIAVLFDNAMKLLWPNEVKRDDILLFVTDAAPYMVKAARGLKMLYPRMVHLTCLAHALHRVAEEVRSHYPDVDRLIANVKKIFLKAPVRIRKFREAAPELPLPPQPILTRWGTWLEAAKYYCENYTIIEDIVNNFDSEDAASIKIVKELFSSNLSVNLAYIKSNFAVISTTVTRLETTGIQLYESLELMKTVQCELEKARGNVAQDIKTKLQCCVKILDFIRCAKYVML